jgi:hypothetical protein
MPSDGVGRACADTCILIGSHNVPSVPLSDRAKLTALVAGRLFGAWPNCRASPCAAPRIERFVWKTLKRGVIGLVIRLGRLRGWLVSLL